MVVAYLRGLLKPTNNYIHRSSITEDIVLESIAAEELADYVFQDVRNEINLTPVVDEKSIKRVLGKYGPKMNRASELRMCNIYKVEEQLKQREIIENKEQKISLVQLYHFAEKKGILQAFAERDDGPQKPMI